MKVTITVKEVNPDFDQEFADRENDGHESEENIRYNWEDEFEVKDDIKDFGIRNNENYLLEGIKEEKPFAFEIPAMTIIECVGENGVVTKFAASRKLIKDTKKNIEKNGDIHFFLFLKGNHGHVTPIPGIYVSAKDFPKELPVPDEEDITTDEEE
ncbi:hypothetical protein BH09BAC5_BH09BAC5_04850 [soil metagenome]